jgi:hypothetical protein
MSRTEATTAHTQRTRKEGKSMGTLVCWSADKANKLAERLMAQGKIVIMSRMLRGGDWAYSVKFTQ